MDLEREVSEGENLFIIFFDTMDGKTEDIQRSFLVAKKMLKS